MSKRFRSRKQQQAFFVRLRERSKIDPEAARVLAWLRGESHQKREEARQKGKSVKPSRYRQKILNRRLQEYLSHVAEKRKTQRASYNPGTGQIEPEIEKGKYYTRGAPSHLFPEKESKASPLKEVNFSEEKLYSIAHKAERKFESIRKQEARKKIRSQLRSRLRKIYRRKEEVPFVTKEKEKEFEHEIPVDKRLRIIRKPITSVSDIAKYDPQEIAYYVGRKDRVILGKPERKKSISIATSDVGKVVGPDRKSKFDVIEKARIKKEKSFISLRKKAKKEFVKLKIKELRKKRAEILKSRRKNERLQKLSELSRVEYEGTTKWRRFLRKLTRRISLKSTHRRPVRQK